MADALVEVAPQGWQIAVPVPSSRRWTYAYAIALSENPRGRRKEWVLVDLGPDLPSARRAWLNGEARLGWEPGSLRLIVITHAHWEHLGLAAWAQNRWHVPVAMLPQEIAWAQRLFGDGESWQLVPVDTE